MEYQKTIISKVGLCSEQLKPVFITDCNKCKLKIFNNNINKSCYIAQLQKLEFYIKKDIT